jgi:hypothetical protein
MTANFFFIDFINLAQFSLLAVGTDISQFKLVSFERDLFSVRLISFIIFFAKLAYQGLHSTRSNQVMETVVLLQFCLSSVQRVIDYFCRYCFVFRFCDQKNVSKVVYKFIIKLKLFKLKFYCVPQNMQAQFIIYICSIFLFVCYANFVPSLTV